MSQDNISTFRRSNQRKKKNSERFKQDFGLDSNEFGLNGQDFGVTKPRKAGSSVKKKRSSSRFSPKQLIAATETLEAFSEDVATLWCGSGIPVLDNPPSAMSFLRDFVSPSRPCIIRNALLMNHPKRSNSDHETTDNTNSNTRPLHLSLDDIVELDPTLEIVVDATPDGHGDCIRTVLDHSTGKTTRLFVTPEQRTMTLKDFRSQLREGRRQQRRKKQQHRSLDEDSSHSSGDENSGEEEDQYGKRIFSLKNSKKEPEKTHYGLEDFVYEGCTPTNASSTTNPLQVPFSCNPLDDMQDLIMDLIDDKRDVKNDKEGNPSKPSPPPSPPPSVLYYSRQNDCFRSELPSILEATRHAIPESLEFAEEAFGTGKPEAVNLWMGDERASSSMHKDPYENLFYVASGEKVFTLCPPADAPYLYEKDFLSGSFDSQPPKRQPPRNVHPKRQWTVKTGFEDGSDTEEEGSDDDDIRLNLNHNHPSNVDMEPVCPEKSTGQEACPAYVRWIEADVAALTDPHYEQIQRIEFPLLKYAHPIHQVRVQAGELLYLPSLWFHRVTQSRETIGLNYWYNMNFNSPHWCYFQLVSQLQWKTPGLQPSGENGEMDDATEKRAT